MKHATPTVRATNFATAPLRITADSAELLLGLLPRPSPIPSDLAELEAAQAVLDGAPFLDDWLDPEPDLIAAPPSSERRPTLRGGTAAPPLPPSSRACLVAAALGRRGVRGRY